MRDRVMLGGVMAAALLAAAPASAQMPAAAGVATQSNNPFSSLVGPQRERVEERRRSGAVERYVVTSDDRMFLFEERGAVARVQFLCGENERRIDCMLDVAGPSPEIHQLSAIRGPRGDVIYKDARDETLLRIAAYGGATVYWPGEIRGAAASKSFGDDQPLRLGYADWETVVRRAQGAAAQISAMTGTPIYFDVSAGDKSPGANSAVLADAVVTAAKGLAAVARDETGAGVVAARIKRVAFLPASDPEISLGGAVLEIRYVPNLDVSGRLSSAKVAQFLEETL